MKHKADLSELLSRGVAEMIDPENAFMKKLESAPEKIVIKFGVDPTRPDIHLGHAVILRKLRQFQDMGCKVIFLVGDLTAQIGDPTGRSKIRPEASHEEVHSNMQTYVEQVGQILLTDPSVYQWITNSDWYVSINDIIAPDREVSIGGQTTNRLPGNHILNKADYWWQTRMQRQVNPEGNISTTTFLNMVSMLRKITLSQLIERDMFQERLRSNNPIYMHEMLYPVIQGADSNNISDIYGSCDLEVGGTDQTFNMLMGRRVMELAGKNPAQSVMSFKILPGLDGKEKMSKSLDNYIAITDGPNDMFGKIMSIPDHVITEYFELCTFTPMGEIEEMAKNLEAGKINPRDLKIRLAREIVAIYHGENSASAAEDFFIKTFQKKEIPDEIPEIKAKAEEKLSDVLMRAGLVESKSDFRRLIDQGGVHDLANGTVLTDQAAQATKGTYRIGKHRFIKII